MKLSLILIILSLSIAVVQQHQSITGLLTQFQVTTFMTAST